MRTNKKRRSNSFGPICMITDQWVSTVVKCVTSSDEMFVNKWSELKAKHVLIGVTLLLAPLLLISVHNRMSLSLLSVDFKVIGRVQGEWHMQANQADHHGQLMSLLLQASSSERFANRLVFVFIDNVLTLNRSSLNKRPMSWVWEVGVRMRGMDQLLALFRDRNNQSIQWRIGCKQLEVLTLVSIAASSPTRDLLITMSSIALMSRNNNFNYHSNKEIIIYYVDLFYNFIKLGELLTFAL